MRTARVRTRTAWALTAPIVLHTTPLIINMTLIPSLAYEELQLDAPVRGVVTPDSWDYYWVTNLRPVVLVVILGRIAS